MLPAYRIIELVPAAEPARARGADSIAAVVAGPKPIPMPKPSNARGERDVCIEASEDQERGRENEAGPDDCEPSPAECVG